MSTTLMTEMELSQFRGFPTTYANVIAIQPRPNADVNLVHLNNVEPRVEDNAYQLSCTIAYSQNIAEFIRENNVKKLRHRIWNFPDNSSHRETNALVQAREYREDFVDAEIGAIDKKLGIIELAVTLQESRGTVTQWIDIRLLGLEQGYLQVRSHPNFERETKSEEIRKYMMNSEDSKTHKKVSKAIKNIPKHKFPPVIDFRVFNKTVSMASHSQIVKVLCPTHLKGLLLGKGSIHKKTIEKRFSVRIDALPRDEAFVKVAGNDIATARDAAHALVKYVVREDDYLYELHPDLIRDNSKSIRVEEPAVVDVRSLFAAVKGHCLPCYILASKSIVSYTLYIPKCSVNGSLVNVVMDMDLIGLQAVYTRGNIDHWINKDLFQDSLQKAQEYSGGLVGQDMMVSLEAIGFVHGTDDNSRRFYGVLYEDRPLLNHEMVFNRLIRSTSASVKDLATSLKAAVVGLETNPANIVRFTINETIVRRGWCKILPSAWYWDYDRHGVHADSYRSLLPNNRPLGSPYGSTKTYDIQALEGRLLLAERMATLERRGQWITEPLPQRLLPERQTKDSKLLIYFDNSNFWISGKHFFGDLNGELLDVVNRYRATSDPETLSQSHPAYATGNRLFFNSANGWHVNFKRLLNGLGYQSDFDPNWVMVGAVPNEQSSTVWKAAKGFGAHRVMSQRSRANVSNIEDQSLVMHLNKCKERNFYRDNHLTDADDIVLFAGDCCYLMVLLDIVKECPRNRVFVLSWGTSAVAHGLKTKVHDRVFFINLEPYIEAMTYDGTQAFALSCRREAFDRAIDEGRLLRIPIPQRVDERLTEESEVAKKIEQLSAGKFKCQWMTDFRAYATFDHVFVIFLDNTFLRTMEGKKWKDTTVKKMHQWLLGHRSPVVSTTSANALAIDSDDDDDDGDDVEDRQAADIDLDALFPDEPVDTSGSEVDTSVDSGAASSSDDA